MVEIIQFWLRCALVGWRFGYWLFSLISGVCLLISAGLFLHKKYYRHKWKQWEQFIMRAAFYLFIISFLVATFLAAPFITYKSQQQKINELQNDLANIKKQNDATIASHKQPLLTGTATIEVVIDSNMIGHTHVMGMSLCGYFLLAKGQEIFLTMTTQDCSQTEIGNNEVLYRTVCNLDAMDKSVGKPISCLAEAEFAQIHFRGMPENSRVIRGLVICTFNSSKRIEIPVPSQIMTKDAIIIPEIQKYLIDFKK